MKTNFLILALAFGTLVLQSCEKEDLPNPDGNKAVENTFKSKYSGITRAEWERKGNYWVVDFWKDGREMEAWFNLDGNWYKTETDIRFDELPEAVKTSFQSGDYKDWRVDDVDMIEYNGAETVYLLDVEKGEQDYDLHYLADGMLVKAVVDRG